MKRFMVVAVAALALAPAASAKELLGLQLCGSSGCVTGASARNWSSYAPEVQLAPQLEGAPQALLCDPQTSGGLLIACTHDVVAEVVRILRRHGCAHAAAIGVMTADAPIVRVEP